MLDQRARILVARAGVCIEPCTQHGHPRKREMQRRSVCWLTPTCRMHTTMLRSLRNILEAGHHFVIHHFAGLPKPQRVVELFGHVIVGVVGQRKGVLRVLGGE